MLANINWSWLLAMASARVTGTPLPYKLHYVVGVGSFGKVLVATQVATKRVVAIKACSRAHMVARQTVDRIQTEVSVLKMLSSPFVNTLVASFKTATKVCLVLEFEQGGELYRLFRLKNGTLDGASVRVYTAQLTLALEELHRLHVAFRDLKLENVLLSARGNVKLCAFSLIHAPQCARTRGANLEAAQATWGCANPTCKSAIAAPTQSWALWITSRPKCSPPGPSTVSQWTGGRSAIWRTSCPPGTLCIFRARTTRPRLKR